MPAAGSSIPLEVAGRVGLDPLLRSLIGSVHFVRAPGATSLAFRSSTIAWAAAPAHGRRASSRYHRLERRGAYGTAAPVTGKSGDAVRRRGSGVALVARRGALGARFGGGRRACHDLADADARRLRRPGRADLQNEHEGQRTDPRQRRGYIKQGKLKLAGAQFGKASEAFGKAVKQIAAVPQPSADAAKLAKWIGYLDDQTKLLAEAGKALTRRRRRGPRNSGPLAQQRQPRQQHVLASNSTTAISKSPASPSRPAGRFRFRFRPPRPLPPCRPGAAGGSGGHPEERPDRLLRRLYLAAGRRPRAGTAPIGATVDGRVRTAAAGCPALRRTHWRSTAPGPSTTAAWRGAESTRFSLRARAKRWRPAATTRVGSGRVAGQIVLPEQRRPPSAAGSSPSTARARWPPARSSPTSTPTPLALTFVLTSGSTRPGTFGTRLVAGGPPQDPAACSTSPPSSCASGAATSHGGRQPQLPQRRLPGTRPLTRRASPLVRAAYSFVGGTTLRSVLVRTCRVRGFLSGPSAKTFVATASVQSCGTSASRPSAWSRAQLADQVGEDGDRLGVTERGEAVETERVEIVPGEQAEILVVPGEQARFAVVEQVALADRLPHRRRTRPGRPRRADRRRR